MLSDMLTASDKRKPPGQAVTENFFGLLKSELLSRTVRPVVERVVHNFSVKVYSAVNYFIINAGKQIQCQR